MPLARWALLGLLLLGACSRADRGQCLKSHIQHHHTDAYDTLEHHDIEFGEVSIPIYYTEHHPAEDWDTTECDQWECPSQTWLKDVKGEETICLSEKTGTER